MKREIKFRGLQTDGKGWVYGWYSPVIVPILGTLGHCINEGGYRAIDVIPESVGQFTGLQDKNGVDIYEGDNVKILYTDWGSKDDSDYRTLEEYLESLAIDGVVVFDQEGWCLECWSDKYQEKCLSSINCGKYGYIKVIGNIHEPINH